MERVDIHLKDIFPFFMILGRVLGMMITAPGFGEVYIPLNIRLILAAGLTLALTFVASPHIPVMPSAFWESSLLLMGEISIGLFIGVAVKIIFSALHVAGTIIGYQGGLLNAFVQDPTFEEQASLPALFLMIVAMYLLFATNTHHEIILALTESYKLLPPISFKQFSHVSGELVSMLIHTFSVSFIIAVQISSPFIVLGFLIFAGLGIINRLLPQIQVFFIFQPAQVILSFMLLAFIVPLIFPYIMDQLSDLIKNLWIKESL